MSEYYNFTFPCYRLVPLSFDVQLLYNNNRQMRNSNKDQSTEIVPALSDIVILLGKYENQLQAHREHLTLRNDFNPQSLYKYLAMGEEELTRNHIMFFMEENSQPMRQDESRLLFSIYGYKEKLAYSDFLNYIYPFDMEAVKTISTVHSKKYIKNDQQQPSQQILCIFLLLMTKQVQFLHQFQQLKNEKLPTVSRQNIKKWIKLLKKNAPAASGGINSDYVLTFPEFKGILKKLKNLPQRKAQPICRRLSLQKQNFIGVDQLQVWLKPWFKAKQEQTAQIQSSQTLLEDLTDNLIASK